MMTDSDKVRDKCAPSVTDQTVLPDKEAPSDYDNSQALSKSFFHN